MVLTDIEQHVKPLFKAEKEQLIRDIQRMLVDDEIEQYGDEILREISTPGIVYDIATPTLAPDDSGAWASYQLQQFLAGRSHDI